MKKCHSCGKEHANKSNYCSMACWDRANGRRFKTKHGGEVGSAGESDESHSMSNIYNPFSSLFDRRGDE